MTTLISWIGVDSRGPSSVYLAADSRFTWNKGVTWDFGRKLFASRFTPDALGYCGDVVFASHSLSNAIELAENQLLYGSEAQFEERLESVRSFLQESFEHYPVSQRRDFTVLYATRVGEGMKACFFVGEIVWKVKLGWSSNQLALPAKSGILGAYGSGEKVATMFYRKWEEGSLDRTSRIVYSSFCEHLKTGLDPNSGGAPQLVGLYLKGPSKTIGTIYQGKRWFAGVQSPVLGDGTMECRDELFQRCDSHTLLPYQSAQKHARPSGL